MPENPVASPASTGGAGTFFEQHVAAYWLAQLLVGGIPPILIETVVAEVSFQTEHLGWQTDDFMVDCEGPGGRRRKLVGQVKLSFTVSAMDDYCRTAISDFWKDFTSQGRFSPDDDCFVLVVLRGTNVLLEDFVSLLQCARAAPDGDAFAQRLATPGFVSRKAVQYCDALREIVGDLEGEAVAAAKIWSFLRLLHVLSLDLNTSTRQAEAQIKALLAHTVRDGDPLAVAANTWDALLAFASTAVPEARSLRRADLPAELQRHGSVAGRERKILQNLKEHSRPVLERIKGTIGADVHLPRAELVQQVLSELTTAQVVLVSGPAGSGKVGHR